LVVHAPARAKTQGPQRGKSEYQQMSGGRLRAVVCDPLLNAD
jgi:hypothetical protein